MFRDYDKKQKHLVIQLFTAVLIRPLFPPEFASKLQWPSRAQRDTSSSFFFFVGLCKEARIRVKGTHIYTF